MKFELGREDLVQGRMNQAKNKETPASFGVQDGASEARGTARLDTMGTRMAGEEGQRAITTMTDPAEMERTQRWMQNFGLTNEGFNFNQAKMNMGYPVNGNQMM